MGTDKGSCLADPCSARPFALRPAVCTLRLKRPPWRATLRPREAAEGEAVPSSRGPGRTRLIVGVKRGGAGRAQGFAYAWHREACLGFARGHGSREAEASRRMSCATRNGEGERVPGGEGGAGKASRGGARPRGTAGGWTEGRERPHRRGEAGGGGPSSLLCRLGTPKGPSRDRPRGVTLRSREHVGALSVSRGSAPESCRAAVPDPCGARDRRSSASRVPEGLGRSRGSGAGAGSGRRHVHWPASHLPLCGPGPRRPRSSTGLRPRGRGPLLQTGLP